MRVHTTYVTIGKWGVGANRKRARAERFSFSRAKITTRGERVAFYSNNIISISIRATNPITITIINGESIIASSTCAGSGKMVGIIV
jgi:hypothetical protein